VALEQRSGQGIVRHEQSVEAALFQRMAANRISLTSSGRNSGPWLPQATIGTALALPM
jgi:hypothetical protein